MLAVCVQATADHRLDRVLVAALTLLAAAAVRGRRPAAPGRAHAARDAGVGAAGPADRRPAAGGPGPGATRRRPRAAGPVVLDAVGLRPQDADGWGLHDVDLTLTPGDRVALVGQVRFGQDARSRS